MEAYTKKAPLTKKTLKPYSLTEARGCHLFALQIGSNATTSSLLRQTCKLAVAIGKKVRNPFQAPRWQSHDAHMLL